MREVVLDSSVILKWFTAHPEPRQREARALQAEFVGGRLQLKAPRFLMYELLNTAARKWRWTANQLTMLADDLELLRIELLDPSLADVARWAASGLTAYDAAYVAVAEAAGIELVTDDREMVELAPEIARPLAGVTS